MNEITVSQDLDDLIQPFQLEESNLRGRIIRIGTMLDEILSAHDYPYPVAHLVAETASLAILLSFMLKYDGIFTLQTTGDGPIKMLVADVTSEGEVRACAAFDEDRVERARQQLTALKTVESSQNHLAQYMGKGYIAFTVDQGEYTDRYQGIVELQGSSLVDCVQHYFKQSEQIATGIKMAAGLRDGKWRAGGIMLQRLPEAEAGAINPPRTNVEEDDWRRSMIFMDSCTDDEFLDPALDPNTLLYRLFHEEGVRVYEPMALKKGCRCSQDKVEAVLATMSEDDIDFMDRDGEIEMNCEFCSRSFVFPTKTARNVVRKAQAR